MTDVTSAVERAWKRTLDTGTIGSDDDFFVHGGTSLLAARMIAELNDEFGLAMGFRTLLDNSTPGALADTLAAELARRRRPANTERA